MIWSHSNVQIDTFKQMEIILSIFRVQSVYFFLTFGLLIFGAISPTNTYASMEIPGAMRLIPFSTSFLLWWFLFFSHKNIIKVLCVYLYP